MEKNSSRKYTKIVRVRLDLIDRDPNQPREQFDKEKISKLADSFDLVGLIQIPVIRHHPIIKGRYMIIAGERRIIALQMKNVVEEDLVLYEGNLAVFKISLVENLHREALDPIAEGHSFQKLRDKEGMSLREIAELTGHSIPNIQAKLKLLTLPAIIKKMVATGNLPQIHALNLRTVGSNEKKLIRMAHQLIAGEMPAEMMEQQLEAIPLPENTSTARLPSTAFLTLRGLVENVSRMTNAALLMNRFLHFPQEEQINTWEKLNKRAQGAIVRCVKNFIEQAQRFLVLIEGYENSGNQNKEDERRIANKKSLEVVAALLRYILYKEISLHVTLSSVKVARFLGVSLDKGGRESVNRSVARAFRVLSSYWYRSKDDCDPGCEDFSDFAQTIKRDYKATDFNAFIDLIQMRNTYDDPLDLTLAKDKTVFKETNTV
jgi:ParB/RepB/Spo0J family partition protein